MLEPLHRQQPSAARSTSKAYTILVWRPGTRESEPPHALHKMPQSGRPNMTRLSQEHWHSLIRSILIAQILKLTSFHVVPSGQLRYLRLGCHSDGEELPSSKSGPLCNCTARTGPEDFGLPLCRPRCAQPHHIQRTMLNNRDLTRPPNILKAGAGSNMSNLSMLKLGRTPSLWQPSAGCGPPWPSKT